MLDAAHRPEILINEVRSELKGSLVSWAALFAGSVLLAMEFGARAAAPGFVLWLGSMGMILTVWLAGGVLFVARPPTDKEILSRWIPFARSVMWICNLTTAGSVWVFLPVADTDLRALLLVIYAWYLIVQFAGATEATQVLRSAVVMLLGSLTAWLLMARPPYYLTLSLLLPLFGATLIAIRRFVRQAVVRATTERAAADAARLELASALASLERERDAKTHFIRAASHDLQQPLHAAALFLDRVRPHAKQAAQVDGLRRALTAARGLVGAMLEHLKLESGAIRPDISTFAAAEVFYRALQTQSPQAAAAGLSLSTVGASIIVRADPLLLARALENLIANAIRHSGGRRILVGARRARGTTTFWVLDDGRGVLPEDADRIFSPFEQGARVGPAGGFGLGLASARELAALMGASCGVAQGFGPGAAFYIRFGAGAADSAGQFECAA